MLAAHKSALASGIRPYDRCPSAAANSADKVLIFETDLLRLTCNAGAVTAFWQGRVRRSPMMLSRKVASETLGPTENLTRASKGLPLPAPNVTETTQR